MMGTCFARRLLPSVFGVKGPRNRIGLRLSRRWWLGKDQRGSYLGGKVTTPHQTVGGWFRKGAVQISAQILQ
ncbi:MAG: hypothetical protein NZ602_12905 [Thermoguttaceae bacterium]|nr:hypothetical protein [Thermoguttaceae bacterium]MDW8038139.1 hypothetical protein [Thermoguttaceae bacterium]